MKKQHQTWQQMPFICLLAVVATLLVASLFGCNIYRHEEVEMIRCPVIEADTIGVPDWEETNYQ